MKSLHEMKDTFKKMNFGGSIMKAYYHLKKRRREIGDSVKEFDKMEMMDNPNAYKLNTKEYTEENNYNKKLNNEPLYKTHIVNINNFEELMQSNDKLTENNKLLVQLFDRMKDRTPKSQVSSNLHTHRLKQNPNYNQTFSSSELWKTPRHKLLSTAATFGIGKSKESDANKKPIYFKKDLNPLLLRVIKYASCQQEKNETYQKEIGSYIKAYETYGINSNSMQSIMKGKSGFGKMKMRKYKDNSKFSFPLINKIIYDQKKKVDVFEKAKENMIIYFEHEYKKSSK